MKSIRGNILFIVLTLVVITSLISCAPFYSQQDLDEARQQALVEGFVEGYREGKDVGYEDGYTKGKAVGLITGLTRSKLSEKEPGELKVHFIDVGQGDSILVDLGETEILIDGGGKSSGVVEYLSDFVDGTLEVMVATHPHADHIGGLIGVLNAFEVDEIWLNGDTSTSQTYSQFISAVNSEGAQVYEVRRGDTSKVGELAFNVLHPVNLSGTTNNNSIVLSLSYEQIDFLFSGDAEQEAEVSILTEGIVPDVEILKVGHHGSKSSSSAQFLDAVNQEVAFNRDGEGNSYWHPHQETITALAEVGAKIYGTNIHGTIIITTEGEQYSLQLEIPEAPPVVSPTLAKFAVSNLSISPDDVEPGRTVTISVTITNSGGSSGSYSAILKINGSQVETKSITLNAGENQGVSFTVVKESTGIYTVEVNGSQGTFTVKKGEQPLFLEIVYVTDPIGKGYTATLRAKTVPEAYCTITVYYKSGRSSASGLYPKEADSQGNVSWSWKVGTRTTPGSWRIVVTASLDGDTVSQTRYFRVY